ncbi:hypothetical protein [Wocania ichthyoenteri]|uniref:hypothetical protein n=1 Tax=Wocania ichthyoenteri TaxID=1230531 RepID=UPI00053E2058|nr:hypothetical protein [Wocania ichthyoenteri]
MLQNLLPFLQYGNRYCGIEHTSKKGEGITYITILKKAKKEIDIEDHFSSKSIKNTADKLPKNQHVFLVINDEQVLTKSLKAEQINGLNLVNKAFPNINISEFYYEIINQGNISFVSICRKEYVEQLIKEYHDSNIHIISFSLGNTILSNTISYIESTSIFTSNASILTDNNLIKTIDFVECGKEEHYNINGLNISNAYILSLSSALSSILNNFTPSINYQDKKSALLNIYKQIRFFNQFLKIGLLFILCILSINFIFFNYYFEKVDVLDETSQLNQTSKERIIKLNESVNKAQKMTDDMLKSSISKSSFYINNIIQSLPNSIILSEINYQPLEKRIKEDNPIFLKNNVLTVSGKSNNSTQYSEWISLLENMDWIGKVTVETYGNSKTTASNFSIKISITP